jgi:inner membrane protein
MNVFSEAWMIWATVGLGLMVLELMAPGLVVIFFGLGALLTAVVVAFTGIDLTGQLLVFLVSSVVGFLVLRARFKSLFQGDTDSAAATKDDRNFTGAVVRVIEPIAPLNPGKVELNGVPWLATASQPFATGDMVKVVGRHSLTLEVAKA